MVDITGKPIPNAQFRVNSRTVVADKNGRWTSQKIDFYGAQISSGVGWTLVRPRQVRLPADKPVRVVLRRPVFRSVSGRVTSTDGKPLVGAKVSLVAQGGYSNYAGKEATVTTRADGRFVFAKLPEGIRPYEVVVQMEGYVTVSGPGYGDFTRVGKDWKTKDTILAKTQPPLTGTVVRADGTPATGACVVANPGAAKMATAAQDGTFTLRNLIGGDVKLTAFEGDEAVTVSFHLPSDSAPKLILKPVAKLAPQDVNRAYEILLEVMSKPRFWARDNTVRMLDKYDRRLADKLHEAAGIPVDNRLGSSQIFSLMLNGPENPALHTGEPLVPVKEEQKKPFSAYLDAARGLAAFEKEKQHATELLDSAEATLRSMTSEERANAHYETVLAFGLTGALASRLSRPSAATWRDFALTLLEGKTEGGYGRPEEWQGLVISLAMRGGRRSYELYEEEVSAGARIKALSDTIRRIALTQTSDALELFQKLEPLYKAQKRTNRATQATNEAVVLGRAMIVLSKALAISQPQRALAIARRIPNSQQRSWGLALAAAGLSGDARAAVYDEAFSAAGQFGLAHKAFVAALASDADPIAGRALFQKVLKVAEPMSRSGTAYIDVNDVAFYLARSDRGTARRLLEQSLAFNKFRARTGSYLNAESVAVAMAAVDFDRALELSREIKDSGQASMVQAAIAKFALASEVQRQEMRFSDLRDYSRGFSSVEVQN